MIDFLLDLSQHLSKNGWFAVNSACVIGISIMGLFVVPSVFITHAKAWYWTIITPVLLSIILIIGVFCYHRAPRKIIYTIDYEWKLDKQVMINYFNELSISEKYEIIKMVDFENEADNQ